LFWYGIHTAEVLYSKMGPGCKEVCTRKTAFESTFRVHDIFPSLNTILT
jgi:hypothetical protein